MGFLATFFGLFWGASKLGGHQKKKNAEEELENRKVAFKKYNHAAYLVSECGGLL